MDTKTANCLIARSGGGKDTQAKLLQGFFEAAEGKGSAIWVSVGDSFRALVKGGGFVGDVIQKKILGPGNFAPPFLAIWAWSDLIIEQLKSGPKHVIFPSSPRTLQEARDLDDFADFFDLQLRPIYLDVEYDEAFRRLKARGRADDTDDVIRRRLYEFDAQVLPAVRYFEQESKNRLIVVDGNPSDPELIHRNLLLALGLA